MSLPVRGVLLLLACALVALGAGCGQGETAPDATAEQRDEIEAKLAEIRKAIDKGDARTVCESYSQIHLDRLGGECEQRVGLLLEESSEAAAADLPAEAERILVAPTGDRARVYAPGSEEFTRFVLEEGDWRLSPTGGGFGAE